jgi:hypothetical protein
MREALGGGQIRVLLAAHILDRRPREGGGGDQ